MKKSKFISLAKIKANQQNPRIISESKLKKLINSLLVFPKMMMLRPITVDENLFVLGGNMRQTALGRIAQMTLEEVQAHIETLPEFNELPDGGAEVLAFWEKFLEKPQVEIQIAEGLTDDEKQQFIIKDNVSFGDWDYDELDNWDSSKLEAWGLDTQLPDFVGTMDIEGEKETEEKKVRETERLSEIRYNSCYYEPVNTPYVNLEDCIDLDLYNKKLEVIEKSSLSDEVKETMKLLAYRFIRIDFESVANYYAYQATEEEKKVIERLRCVLVDGSLDGFIEDSLLRVTENLETKNS